jgi:predicted GH43/DUF377 family glycosyl hydrolase
MKMQLNNSTLKKLASSFSLMLFVLLVHAQSDKNKVPPAQMEKIYQEVKTPYKYGLVMAPEDNSKMLDSPSVFRKGSIWYMTYIIFDGMGYETWLAQSENLLDWQIKGKLMSFTTDTDWDCTQKAGYISLLDSEWEGNYKWEQFQGKYWMSYLGGSDKGYEAGLLSVGIAHTDKNPAKAHEWLRLSKPVLMSTDKDVRWWENTTIYKSSIIWDKSNTLGYPFIMYYNAKGDSINPNPDVERIGMAVSDDMIHWKRYLKDPVLNHHEGITGDAVIRKIDNLWVMFYFGAFWKNQKGAFNRFACSYDLVNWTDWAGENLIQSSEDYDSRYAHKSFVVKWDGIVYHFYCAVNQKNQRGIAVATSKNIGKSKLTYTNQ